LIIDEQNCTLKFASWTYDSARIDLSENSNSGDLSNFMANSGKERISFFLSVNGIYFRMQIILLH